MLRQHLNRFTLLHLAAMAATIIAAFSVQARLNPVTAQFDLTSPVLVTTRTQFRLCVQTNISDPEQQDHILEHIIEAQKTIQQRPDWQLNSMSMSTPKVDCEVNLPDELLQRGVPIKPGVTTEPSPYRTMVFVLDEEGATNRLGTNQAILIPYEMMQIDEHNIAQVTSALIVRDTFLDSPEFVEWYFSIAVGMPPTIERLSGEEGTGPDK